MNKLKYIVALVLFAQVAYADWDILAVNTNTSSSNYEYLNYSNAVKTYRDQYVNAPDDNEFAKAGWVRKLNSSGSQWFFTANITNGYGEKITNFVALSSVKPTQQITNTIISPVTATTYLAGGITTQSFSILRSPVTFEVWVNRVSGNSASIVNAHPEIYYVYNGTTNQLGDYSSGSQLISDSTTPKKYTWSVSFEPPTLTGLVYVVGYLKTDTVSGPACSLSIYGGGDLDSHMNIDGVKQGDSSSDIINQVKTLLNQNYSVTNTYVVSNSLDFSIQLLDNRVSIDDIRMYSTTTNDSPVSKRASIQVFKNSNRRCDKMVYLYTNQLYWKSLNTVATTAGSTSNTVSDASGIILNDLYYIADNNSTIAYCRPTNTTSTIIYWGSTNLYAYTTTSLVSHVNQFGSFNYSDELNTSNMWFRLTFTTPYTTTVQTVINYGK